MWFEMRTYRLKVGALPTYLQRVGQTGLPIQRKHLGDLVGYFHTDIGPLNEIIHVWRYDTLDDRDRRRNALAGDPAWQAFLPSIQTLIDTMDSKILRATAFSPTDLSNTVQP